MSEDPHARLRVAIYNADGSVKGLMSGVRATVQANTPPGGTWRVLPAGVRRIADVRRADRPSVGGAAPSVGFADSSPKGGAS